MKTKIFLVITCIQFSTYFCEPNYDIEFERAEGIDGPKDTEVNYDAMRIIHNRDGYFLNGTFSYYKDFDNTYTCGFTSGRSDGSSQFSLQAYRNEFPCCEFFKKIYGRIAQPMFLGKSNFPIVSDNGPCPIPKGYYYLKNAEIKDMYEQLPGRATPGFWKVDTVFMNPKKEVVGGFRLFFRVTHKY